MSLREEILDAVPDFVTDVKIKDGNIHGLEAKNVIVYYTIHGKNMFLDLNFADKNKMTARHIAAVVNSYLPNYNEGGSF